MHQNTIVARDRDMLAGIAIVANPIFVKPGVEIDGVAVRYVHLLSFFGLLPLILLSSIVRTECTPLQL